MTEAPSNIEQEEGVSLGRIEHSTNGTHVPASHQKGPQKQS